MFNINEVIWEKHAFLVRDFFTFWKVIEIKILAWLNNLLYGLVGLTETYLRVSYLYRLIAMACHQSALKLPHKRKFVNFEGQKHPLIMVSR